MLASIKLEVMSPSGEAPDEGSIGMFAVDLYSHSAFALRVWLIYLRFYCGVVPWCSAAVEFHMPPICSPLVRPGRPAEVAPVISKNLEDILMRYIVPCCCSIRHVPCPLTEWAYHCAFHVYNLHFA